MFATDMYAVFLKELSKLALNKCLSHMTCMSYIAAPKCGRPDAQTAQS